ncbi:FAD:protein FMN transferase [Bacteroidetes bacterium endosymbiont of Geopemphigus sp.]|uniref:FAD:protein FMN transferase n=1 Tax=Bacteroidetes bacterium endosymbiont of Geopemphigus sp. TaxID=2047937 RepID=UPI0018A85B68|nr:FAD:protein FMN transferase [Bacteroidetes bacterium endosymbiont of Geopemphigus sp.]
MLCKLSDFFLLRGKSESIELKGKVFGTYYHIKYRGTENYATSINLLFEEMILTFSIYTPESDISKFNEGNSPIEMNKHFQIILNKTREIHKNSRGAFWLTYGASVRSLEQMDCWIL